MARDNYYILLGLDPSITDISLIEDKIKEKQREWSSQRNHPTYANQAKANLDQLKDIREVMIDDSSLRDIERKEATVIRQQQQQKAEADLTNLINSLAIKGYIFEKEVQKLVKRFNKQFTDAEIRNRISSKFTIRQESSKSQKVKKEVLERTTLQSIENELKIIQKKDLYEFLDINQQSTLLAINNTIQKKAVELQKNNNKSANLTAQHNLIGHCRSIFKNDNDRLKYDNSLSFDVIRELEKDIDILGSSAEIITADSWSNIVSQARTKGIPQDEAEDCIINYARKKGWSIERPTTSTTEDKLICCGNCRGFNDSKSKKCVHCKEDLYIQCIKCNTENLSENIHCSNCGFSLADYFSVTKLLREADKKIVHHNWTDAENALNEAELYWPNYDKIIVMKEKLNTEREKESQEISEIENLIATGRLFQAKKRIQSIKQHIKENPTIDDLENQIAKGLQKTQHYIKQAEKFESSGKTEKAVEKYLEVLQVCQDDPFIKNKLASYPPPSPSNLSINTNNEHILIEWDAETKKTVSFRVLRNENTPAKNCKDGTIVDETSEQFYEDENCEPGIAYYYSVYSIRAGVPSIKAAVASQPVLYAPDVKEICISSGNRVVHFKWKPVINSDYVEIWKKEGVIPEEPNDGICFKVDDNYFEDINVENGRDYGYLIFTVFKYNKQIIRSRGLGQISTPKLPPEPITTLNFNVKENTIQLFWAPPRLTDRVHIIKSENKPKYQLMDLISESVMSDLGNEILSTTENSTTFNISNEKFIFFTPVSQQGDNYVVGNYIMFSNIEDVSDISATTVRGQIKVKWLWPKDINYVAVLLKETNYATHPNDKSANKIVYSREKYQRKGGFRYDAQNINALYIRVQKKIICNFES